jgi:hypothetical protein
MDGGGKGSCVLVVVCIEDFMLLWRWQEQVLDGESMLS